MAKKRINLITARIDAGLSQEALAETFDVSTVTISNWENGHTNPFPYYQGKLKAFFGCKTPKDLETLLEISGDDKKAEAPPTPPVPPAAPVPILWRPSSPG